MRRADSSRAYRDAITAALWERVLPPRGPGYVEADLRRATVVAEINARAAALLADHRAAATLARALVITGARGTVAKQLAMTGRARPGRRRG